MSKLYERVMEMAICLEDSEMYALIRELESRNKEYRQVMTERAVRQVFGGKKRDT